MVFPEDLPLAAQVPGIPTPLGSFDVTLLGDKQDKIGKDDNFRGMTVFNNVVYYTKGSGSNGVNTVYFVDTTGSACPKGVGLPSPSATLPTTPLAYTSPLASGVPLPEQHVHPERLSHVARQGYHSCASISFRDMVRER